MFITTVYKKNKNSPKKYEYQQLCESIRTPKGPRKKFVLNLGKIPLPKEKWPLLAKRIADYIKGQNQLFCGDPDVEELALQYSEELLFKYETDSGQTIPNRYESVDIESMTTHRVRTVGIETTGLSFLKQLELDLCFKKCGLSQRQIEVAILLIISRLAGRRSERSAHIWSKNVSGLDELLKTDFRHLSLNTLYRVSDQILKHQESIEQHLSDRERDLFGLDETIILYDLTNTYLEGLGSGNPKAKFGHSKEKRSDCRLLTLGLVLDGQGFPKLSRVFAGNQNEAKTLKGMTDSLDKARNQAQISPGAKLGQEWKPTVVMDAGIATEASLKELRGKYHYICVSRRKMDSPAEDAYIELSTSTNDKVKAQMFTSDGEVYLYCQAPGRQAKERGIQSRLEQLFEEKLCSIASSIHKKHGTKKYSKVCERIGRVKEKYSRISRYYTIAVEEKNGVATDVSWQYSKQSESDQRFSGSYFLWTDRTDLSEQAIWDTYTMLTDLEDAFRTMKTELGIRPNHHKKECRSDGHIFITVLAYHALHSIRTRLKEKNINYRLETLRLLLQSHTRSTKKMRTEDGKTLCIRQCSEPESHQRKIYDALNLDRIPCPPKRFKI